MSMLNELKQETNYGYTENGAIGLRSTLNPVLDLFAMGGAYRGKTDDDCIVLFNKAYKSNPEYALKCLFYLRSVLSGQGERRFFRVCINWLAKNDPEAVIRNIDYIAKLGRWDDLYSLIGTDVEPVVWDTIKNQLALDLTLEHPSLLAKWLKSCNTSSKESQKLGNKTRKALGMTQRQYRKTLAYLRKKINIVERLMSEGKWDQIDFSKVPSLAGLKYRAAFERHDIDRGEAISYKEFAAAANTTVNTKALTPVDIAHKVFRHWDIDEMSETERNILNKAWEQQKDWYNGREENGIAVVDVSGSMCGTPMEAAISMGAYIAERGKGPYANHFITFSREPELVEFEGVDIADKFFRAQGASWQMNTNLEAVFDLLLDTALKHNLAQEDMVEKLIILSDMQFDQCLTTNEIVSVNRWNNNQYQQLDNIAEINTLIQTIQIKWNEYGYKLPNILFWNLRASTINIPAIGSGFSYCSGFSLAAMEAILSGRDGIDMMLKVLNQEDFKNIR